MFSRLRARLRNRRFDEDLAEELRFHEEMKRQELEAEGRSTDAARHEARRALGNVTLMREDSRRVWIAGWVESVLQDTRYALRSLARQPLHSAATILILVFGIGLTTTLFTMFKAMMLDPWPVRDPASIVRLWARTDGRPVGPSVNEFRFMRQHVRSMSGLVAHHGQLYPARLEWDGRPYVSLPSIWVTANFFEVMGVRPQLGRGFLPEDDLPGHRLGSLVISDTAWRLHFLSDPEIIGRRVTVSGQPFTIVGVLPRSFDGLGRESHLWMPLSALSAVRPSDGRAWEGRGADLCCVNVVGRLAPGVERRQAQQELQLLHERYSSSAGRSPGSVEFRDTSEISSGGKGLQLMAAFAAAVGLILLLACANVGNLQLARALVRRREIATRISIGASRSRVIRQLLTEGLVVAVIAGTLAIGAASLLPGLIFALVDEEIPSYVATRLVPGAGVLMFTAAICAIAAFAFALAPALHATRITVPLGLVDRAATRRTRFHLRSVLLATQVAACTALLAGAGLLTRAIVHAMSFDPGFQVEGVSVITPVFPSGTSMKEREAFAAALRSAVNGGEGPPVALVEMDPLSDANFVMFLATSDGRPGESVLLRRASAEYFDVLGIPFVSGRPYARGVPGEVVVNESYARAYWPGGNPLGKPVHQAARTGEIHYTYTIVGVVRDAHVTGFRDIEPVIFAPASSGMFLTRGGAPAFARLQAASQGVNRSVSLTHQPLRASVRQALNDSMIGAAFAWGLGLLGLALAAVGIFGVFAYSVEERRREIGVRLALGAARGHIVRMLLSSSGRAIFGGLLLGLVLSLACGPVLRSYLFGLSPLDPMAYVLVLLLMTIAAAAATFAPAMRACRVDPAITLRED
jgi:predicted permease